VHRWRVVCGAMDEVGFGRPRRGGDSRADGTVCGASRAFLWSAVRSIAKTDENRENSPRLGARVAWQLLMRCRAKPREAVIAAYEQGKCRCADLIVSEAAASINRRRKAVQLCLAKTFAPLSILERLKASTGVVPAMESTNVRQHRVPTTIARRRIPAHIRRSPQQANKGQGACCA